MAVDAGTLVEEMDRSVPSFSPNPEYVEDGLTYFLINDLGRFISAHSCWGGFAMKSRQASKMLGAVGTFLLLIFWMASTLIPKQADAVIRPYGLFAWFGVLTMAILLPGIAAIRGSKWWFLVVGASLMTAGRFFLTVMA
jgi:hypothetical protein